MEGQFRLISCVDPSKTPHQLKERFAKLTLSKSSKKKDEIRYGHQQDSPTESVLTSKKLFDDLLTDDESDKDEDKPAEGNENKIFISQTSARKSLSFSQRLILSSDDSDATFCSAESTERESIGDGAMEQLRITSTQDTHMDETNSQPIFTQNDEKDEVVQSPLDDSLTKLSSQIGSLALKSPIKLLSPRKDDTDALTETKVFRNIQEDDTKVDTDDSILTISSGNSTPQKMECMSPENVPTSDAEEEVIILSDTDAEAEEASRIVSSIGRTSGRAGVGLSASAVQRLNEFFDRFPTGDASIDNSIDNKEDLPLSVMKNKSEGMPSKQDLKSMDTVESPMTTNFSKTSSSEKHNDSFEESVHDATGEGMQDSIELSETSCEEDNEPEEDKMPQSNVPKSTNSTVQETPAATPAPTPRSSENFVESINISAKINIKIHISQTNLNDSSENSENSNSRATDSAEDRKSIESQSSHASHTSSEEIKSKNNESSEESEQVVNMKCAPNLSLENDASLSNDKKDLDKSCIKENSPPNKQIEKHRLKENESPPDGSILLNAREKQILDKIYGKQWQTPEVLRKIDPKSPISHNDFEESSLGDFTLFHKNIRTDLESTRLPSFGNDVNFKKPIGNIPRSLPKPPVARVTRTGRKIIPKLQTICDRDSSSDEEECEDSDDSSDEFWKREVEKEANKTRKGVRRKKKDEIVYLDLTSGIVQEVDGVQEQNVPEPVKDILKSCEYVGRKKLPGTPTTSNTKGKRKLFTPYDDEDAVPMVEHTFEKLSPPHPDPDGVVKLTTPLPIFTPLNKKLEAIKNLKPSSSSTKKTKDITSSAKKSDDTPSKTKKKLDYGEDTPPDKDLPETPTGKYGFLKSLDVNVSKKYCHPEAVKYRESYKSKKGDLVEKLYKLYNEKLFKNELDVEITWNKKLLNTAGRCTNTRKKDIRISRVELSEKVLTSADRLRCTLIHELCHAATWIFNGEHGHGASWKAWAAKANKIFPELPKIGVCHQYDIEYKYTYKCVVCDAKSHAHSKSKKVENLRCAFCRGSIEVYLNKKDKDGNVIPTPVKEPTGFAKFVKDNYKYHKAPHLKHVDVMKILSIEFAAINIGEKKSDKD